MNNAERRYRPRAELRVIARDGSLGTLVGNAVVYDVLSEPLCGFREMIAPGAFAKALKTADVRCLIDHNSTLLLGRNASGTLRLVDGPKALAIECDLPDKLCARELVTSIDRGDLDGMSFGFVALKDAWTEDGDTVIRTVIEADIFDVSAVTYPAYTDTSIALRSLDAWKATAPPPPQAIDPDELRKLKLRLRSRSTR